ncbi:MAG: SLBB domain-containing protein [Bacteroidia bacterium]|nr:SLBB domain-containing protein [Bacteroidia bacterium]
MKETLRKPIYKQIFSALGAVLICLILNIQGPTASAQSTKSAQENLSAIKSDELNDQQLKSFLDRYLAQGFELANLEFELQKRGMPSAEIQKILARVGKLNEFNDKTELPKSKSNTTKRNTSDNKELFFENQENPFRLLMPKIFGSELFNNPRLSFEPNLKMATPLNYQIGPEDELVIDIFGFTEQSYKLLVSPEGYLRIPNLGPVQVLGLTVEQAQQKIRTQLIKIYPRIASGETSVAVNLGNIRNIQVTILGEVVLPGTYSVPSLASVFNALYLSGGPTMNGSFRNIKLIRGNKVFAKIDMYDFLINGNAKGNIPLKDQDVIKVEPYDIRVELTGFVKRDGFFELLPKESISHLLKYAGGFSPNAYSKRMRVTRNTGTQRSVWDVSSDKYASFAPQNGDVYAVDSILSRYENRVQIEGAVFRPGTYSITENKTLKTLIKNAEGLKEDAFLTRATLLRVKDDNALEMLSVNLKELLESGSDIELRREDKITIASKIEMREEYHLTINGDVIKPGKYPYADNMKIEDLIILAGGLKESASLTNVQVAKRSFDVDKMNANGEIAKVQTFTINKELKTDPNYNYELNPFDIITIFSVPGYKEQIQVEVNGEVMFPGKYVLAKGNERISDIVKRSGGLTASSFAGGAILIRKKGNTYQDLIVKQNKLDALKKLSKDTTKVGEEIEKEMSRESDIVGIDLEKIMKRPGSKEDLYMRDGDVLEIPFLKQTVLVSGQVLYPVRLRYEDGSSFRSYVSRAGGFSSKALKKRSYIVYANGTAKDTKSFLFFKIYPKVKPGAEIVIPLKDEKKNISAIELVTIATSLTSMAFIISTLIK